MLFRVLIMLFFATNLALIAACSNPDEVRQNDQTKNSIEKSIPNETDRLIRLYQNRIMREPHSSLYHIKLGETYIQKGRETGDVKYYDIAQQTLERAIELNPDSYSAYVYLGQVSSFNHEFQRTLSYAKKAVELRPNVDSPYGVLGDAYLELGMYGDAKGAYEKMLSLNPGFYSYSRISHIKELYGQTDGAIQYMQLAIENGIKKNLPKENIAWAEVITGTLYFKSGDLDTAEKYYNKALNTLNGYYLALEHIAEIETIRGNYPKAVELYKKVLELNSNPEFLVALGDVYSKTGNKDDAEMLYEKADKKYQSYLDNGFYGYIVHQVQFYTDKEIKLDEALKLARKDAELRNDIYAYDNLAWIYFKLGDYEKALNASEKSLKFHTNDPDLLYHAAMINFKTENFDNAKKYIELAKSKSDFYEPEIRFEIDKISEKLENY